LISTEFRTILEEVFSGFQCSLKERSYWFSLKARFQSRHKMMGADGIENLMVLI
jgi:hypothetical protein